MNKLKKLFLTLAIMVSAQPAFAYHNFFFRDAGDIISGILNNFRLDASSVTKLGPTINGDNREIDDNSIIGRNIAFNTILSSHVSFSLLGERGYFLTISTDNTGLPDLFGNDRTPFVAAISSAAGGKAEVFVRKGTYTIENVVSDGITWRFEEGVVLRRQLNKMMFKISNGGFIGGTVISTATGLVAIGTPAFVFGSNSKFINTVFQTAQDNNGSPTIGMSTACFISVATAANVLFDGIDLSSYTNLSGITSDRIQALSVDQSTITIRNSKFGCNSPGGQGLYFNCVGLFESNSDLRGNVFANDDGPSVFIMDKAPQKANQSQYRIVGNEFHDFAGNSGGGSGCLVDTSNSSGSLIMNNVFYMHTRTAGAAIWFQGGGYANLAFAPQMTSIIGNVANAADNVATTSSFFLALDADPAKPIVDIHVVGNQANGIATFLLENPTVLTTGLRSNRLNGVLVTDQN